MAQTTARLDEVPAGTHPVIEDRLVEEMDTLSNIVASVPPAATERLYTAGRRLGDQLDGWLRQAEVAHLLDSSDDEDPPDAVMVGDILTGVLDFIEKQDAKVMAEPVARDAAGALAAALGGARG